MGKAREYVQIAVRAIRRSTCNADFISVNTGNTVGESIVTKDFFARYLECQVS
jgi:hypothetical protein